MRRKCSDRAVILKPHKDVPENPKEDICARIRLFGSQNRHKLEVMILATVTEPGMTC